MPLKSTPQRVLNVLIMLIFALVLGNIYSILNYHYTGNTKGLFKLLNFDLENNIPTYYSVITLFLCFILLLFITYVRKKAGLSYYLWFVLSLCFLFISFDECIEIHERVAVFLRDKFALTGILYYAWVIPYGILLMVFALVYYFKFLLKLPRKTQRLFLASGFIYVTGAIGFELLAGVFHNPLNKMNNTTSILYTFEESLEMIGIALFIYALLLYITEELKVTISMQKTASIH